MMRRGSDWKLLGVNAAGADVEEGSAALPCELQELLEVTAPTGEGEEFFRSEVYVPEGYEGGYAYPLILWLSEGADCGFVRRMEAISDRNYLGLSLSFERPVKGEVPAELAAIPGMGDKSIDTTVWQIEESLEGVVRAFRREYHVNPERVYLAGKGENARIAEEMFLRRPAWFSGLIRVGGGGTRGPLGSADYRRLKGTRLLTIGSQFGNERGWEAAGVEVRRLRVKRENRMPARVWREVDRWIMQGIPTAALK